ncbi:MAG: PaaI family thioesterase [Anaerolineae bacterium]|nr:PaaI family thioesterase [Anaerolineae bacterium]
MTDAQQPDPPSGQPDGRRDQQPSSKWCFVCGVENPCGLCIRFFNDGHHRVLARVTLGDQYQSYPGVAHGGILATILDETMGRAILAEGTEGEARPIVKERFMFTAKMEMRYLQPVPLHQEFTVRGRVEKDRGRMVMVSGEVVLPDGSVAVKASATLVDIPPDQIEQMVQADVGWQVYP